MREHKARNSNKSIGLFKYFPDKPAFICIAV
jgi:hypothetical protein